MILRLPNKSLLCLFSFTGAAVAGAVWTFHGDAGIASNGRAVHVPVVAATYPNDKPARNTTGRGSGRGKSGRGGRYVSQMLALAAGGNTLHFRLEDRNLGFGANGVDVSANDVETKSDLDSLNHVSLNLGNLAAGGHKIAFAEDPSIPQGPRQPGDDGEPIDNIYPPNSIPPNSNPPIPPHSTPPIPPSASVPDSGATFVLMLCSGAGLLIMGRLASRQLEK